MPDTRLPGAPVWRAIALFAIVGTACGSGGDPALAPPAGEAWLTPEQVRRNLTLDVVGEHEVGTIIPCGGRIVFDELRVAHVFPPVSGIVTQIFADPGMHVVKGAALALIQSPDLGATFSDLDKAQSQRVAAARDFNRKKELLQYRAVSRADYDAAEDSYRKARAEEARARKKARLLKKGTADAVTQAFTLRSPIDGSVITRGTTPGLEVQGSFSGGTPIELFTVGDLQVVWMIADVYEVDLARVKTGQRVVVRVVTYPNRVFEGRVDWVSDALDAVSRTGKVRCSLSNLGRELKPEMFVTAQVHAHGRLALAVPRAAVLFIGDDHIVFVEKRDRFGRAAHGPNGESIFVRKPVVIDEEDQGDYLPIKSGLERGEQIVVAGALVLLGSS